MSAGAITFLSKDGLERVTITASTTWTVPTGVSNVYVIGCGAGGAGGFGGQGGNGGEIYGTMVAVTPGGSVSVTIGQSTIGSAGGDTVFDTYTWKGGNKNAETYTQRGGGGQQSLGGALFDTGGDSVYALGGSGTYGGGGGAGFGNGGNGSLVNGGPGFPGGVGGGGGGSNDTGSPLGGRGEIRIYYVDIKA